MKRQKKKIKLTVVGSSKGWSSSACLRKTFPLEIRHSILSKAGTLSLSITPATNLHFSKLGTLFEIKVAIFLPQLSPRHRLAGLVANQGLSWFSTTTVLLKTEACFLSLRCFLFKNNSPRWKSSRSSPARSAVQSTLRNYFWGWLRFDWPPEVLTRFFPGEPDWNY